MDDVRSGKPFEGDGTAGAELHVTAWLDDLSDQRADEDLAAACLVGDASCDDDVSAVDVAVLAEDHFACVDPGSDAHGGEGLSRGVRCEGVLHVDHARDGSSCAAEAQHEAISLSFEFGSAVTSDHSPDDLVVRCDDTRPLRVAEIDCSCGRVLDVGEDECHGSDIVVGWRLDRFGHCCRGDEIDRRRPEVALVIDSGVAEWLGRVCGFTRRADAQGASTELDDVVVGHEVRLLEWVAATLRTIGRAEVGDAHGVPGGSHEEVTSRDGAVGEDQALALSTDLDWEQDGDGEGLPTGLFDEHDGRVADPLLVVVHFGEHVCDGLG